MSSPIDPAKLKVVELRSELSKRGLDTKGNKPALVKRLKEALEEELNQDVPDTSIADTSTEDLDTSQSEEKPSPEEKPVPDNENEKCEEPAALPQEPAKTETPQPAENMETEEVPPPTPVESPQADPESQPSEPASENQEQLEEASKQEDATEDAPKQEDATEEAPKQEDATQEDEVVQTVLEEEAKENGEQEEPKSRKSRWGADGAEAAPDEEPDNKEVDAVEAPKDEKEVEPRGEKRRRSSPSPDRSQRRRSKSPIKEDEPPIDNNKVQLSWYDSDLHLQLDKESFLSAKPYHEGAFGFAWAGVRATHGVSSGKVCFEVKITEELKCEDFSKYHERHRRDSHKSDAKRDDDRKKEDDKNKDTAESKNNALSENGSKVENEAETVASSTEVAEADASESENKEITEAPESEEPKQEPMETDDTTDTNKIDESEEQEKEKEQSESLPTHLFRVGWSLLSTGLQLGESEHSYGYESSGTFVANKDFKSYGATFGVGDVIASFLSISDSEVTVSYCVNGVSQSEAVTFPISTLPENFVFFPHVLSRNYAFELNLGSKEESWFSKPEEFADYEFLDKAENRIPGPVRPENRSDCEVILMCGLPAAGKTQWVEEHVQANPDKKYTILGDAQLLEKMTVSGDALKNKFKGSWSTLLDKLQKCLTKLVEVAALRRRNYIIDQTNVYPSAQRRKLRPFEGFKRRAVVVVVGDEEQAKRQSLQEAQGGKDVPDSTVLEMKANMSLPLKGEWIDEVIFAGLDEEEAKALVQKYNNQGRDAGFGIQRRFSHRDTRNRWQNRRTDYRGSNYRDRSYHNNRYDRGPPRQGNWHPQRPGGWNRDRRDNRGPPMGGSRDWRNRGNGRERVIRETHGQGSNYSRNRNQPSRGPGGSWQSGGNWAGQGQGNWNNQPWGGQGSWGSQGSWSGQSNQNQWKYGGGGSNQNYGGYSNWNYYGHGSFAQGWGNQGQAQSTGSPATTNANQYGQYSQQEWAQYAQQYAQQGQTTTGSTAIQPTSQK